MTDLTTGIVVGLAALTTAATGGVYLGFSTMVMPALRGSTATDAVGTMNRINVFAVRSVFMVAFLGSALTCIAAAIFVLGSLPRVDAVLALLGALLGFIGFVVTIAVNVPLNNRLAQTSDGQAYAGFEDRWRRANTLRGTLSLLGAASLIGALVA
jgi:uncharacterized membrane protein